MSDTNCPNWSYGVRFVQWAMNSNYNEAIKMAPYQALTGNNPRCGLKSKLPAEFLTNIGTGTEECEFERLLEDITSETREHITEMPTVLTADSQDSMQEDPDEPTLLSISPQVNMLIFLSVFLNLDYTEM